MAAGPLGRIIAQAVILGISIISRALPVAYAQALQNAKKGGATTQQILRKTIAKEEALQILNLSEKQLTAEAIQKVKENNKEFSHVFHTLML
jgi:import inner membrane translocase subunit TIM16